MYKIVAIDVDDTLLTDDHTVSPGTKQVLAEAIDRGVVVTLATGRMFASARKIAEQIGLDVPLITYHGAIVKHASTGDVIYERYVPSEAAQKIIEFTDEHDLFLQVYHDDVLYVRTDHEKAKTYSRMSNIPYTVEPDFSRFYSLPLTKMLIFEEENRIDQVMPLLAEQVGDVVHLTKSKPYFLEAIHPEGTKGQALHFLAARYGCDISQTIAIGDSWNDRDMLEAAGLGVAMDNAIESLKSIANYVTRSNNDEGVRHVIERFILKA